jgi:sensor histidine kinase YesM
MMNVDKIETTLTNEINFIRNFLSLEQLRLNHLFDFKINLDEKIDPSIMIPRMLLFTFCENAVKHGLKPKGEGGSLIISGILTDQKNLVFTIEDNGIGRKNAAKQKTQGTGMGLKTLNKIISYYNESHNKKITYTLFDRKDGGTIVSIMIKN